MFLLKKNQFQQLKTALYWFAKGPYKPHEFWDKWALTFIHETQQRAIYPQHKLILNKLNQEKPKNLLEVGCGFGRNIKYISENYKDAIRITGIDFSETMVKQARKYLKPIGDKKIKNIALRTGDVRNIPFSDSSFDTVLCHGVLMHIKPRDINSAITELLRVTKKTLLLFEQNDTVRKLNGKSYQKINYFTYTYPYQKLFSKQGAKIQEYHRAEQFDWFVIHALQKSKKL